MKKQFVFILLYLLPTAMVFCQTNPKPVAKKPVPVLEKLLTGSGLPYKMVNDSLAVIPYEGANIPSFQVLVQAISELFIIYTNLSEALPDKLNDTQYKYLLQRNDHFDIVKIGLADDGIFYLRADLYKVTATNPILKRIISQVANVANIIAGEIK
jgi:hypothetical protein